MSLTDEQQEFRDVLRRFLAESCPPEDVRTASATDPGFDASLWKQMTEELGLAGIAIAESRGGQGFGIAELAVAAGELGRALTPSPFFGSAVLAAGALAHVATATECDELLPGICAGEVTALAWTEPESAGWDADGIRTEATGNGEACRLTGAKSFVLDGHTASRLLVVARTPGTRCADGLGLYLVDGDAAGLTRRRLASFDASRPLARLDFEGVRARALGAPGDAWAGLHRSRLEAAVVLCAEMVGANELVVETAVEYARSRHQFGRAIGSFQAIKHKCANMWIALEGSRAALGAAVTAAAEGDPELPLLASIARVWCADAFYAASWENIQIHGGVGFTWEYDAHLYLRRARSSRQLLGDPDAHRELVARELAERAQAGHAATQSSRASSEDPPEIRAARSEIRAWLEANARPRTGDGDWSNGPREHTPLQEAAYFQKCCEWQRAKFDGGWAGITWPKEWGGRSGTPAEQMVFGQEESSFDATSGFLSASIALVGPAILHHGNDAQRERFLRPMLRADETWCQLFSEPEAGSDLAGLRTRAERDGDVFVVNGQKLWTTGAQHCDYGFLLARTNPGVPKHAGISFLLVDMRDPGIEVRPLPTIKGDRHFNEVFFSDVRVPVENVVGGVDGGWAVAKTTLANESVMIGSGRRGLDGADALVAYAQARERWQEPGVRCQVADAYVQERVLGFLQDQMQDAILAGRRPEVDGSVMKVLWSESRSNKAEIAVDIQGPEGLLEGADAFARGFWQELVLDRPMGSIGGGTLEVHRNGIGERVLGLPREPRVDRDVAFRDLKTDMG